MGHYNLVFAATIHGNPTPEDKYLYIDLTGVADYTVADGDWLEYEVFWEQTDAFIAVDLECSDGTALRNVNATDQEGLSAHPSTLLPKATGWYTRKISLTALVGKTVTRYLLACEANSGGQYRGAFRSVRIVRNGTVQRTIWEITDDVPNSEIYRTDTEGANSYSLSRSTNTGPSTPKNVAIGQESPTSLQVSWVDTTNDNDPGWTQPDYWEVELAEEPTFASPRRATASPRSTVNYTFSQLKRNTLYYARVRGVNVHLGHSGWAVLTQGATLFEVSNLVVTPMGQPIAGKVLALDYATLVQWQAGAIPVLATGTTDTGSLVLTGQNGGNPLAILVFENTDNPQYPGNAYRG